MPRPEGVWLEKQERARRINRTGADKQTTESRMSNSEHAVWVQLVLGPRVLATLRSLNGWQEVREILSLMTAKHRGTVHVSSLGFQRAEHYATEMKKSHQNRVPNSPRLR